MPVARSHTNASAHTASPLHREDGAVVPGPGPSGAWIGFFHPANGRVATSPRQISSAFDYGGAWCTRPGFGDHERRIVGNDFVVERSERSGLPRRQGEPPTKLGGAAQRRWGILVEWLGCCGERCGGIRHPQRRILTRRLGEHGGCAGMAYHPRCFSAKSSGQGSHFLDEGSGHGGPAWGQSSPRSSLRGPSTTRTGG